MSGPRVDTTESITIELTHGQLKRLDDLRAVRNLSRGELIGELVEAARPRKVGRRRDAGQQDPNPWGQVWPG